MTRAARSYGEPRLPHGPGQKRTPLTPEQIAEATERLRRGHRKWRENRAQAFTDLRAQGDLPKAKFRARHWEVVLRHLAGYTQAADAVLDRAGYAKTQQVQVHHVHELLRRFTPDKLDRYGRTGEYHPTRFSEVFRQLEGPTDPDVP